MRHIGPICPIRPIIMLVAWALMFTFAVAQAQKNQVTKLSPNRRYEVRFSEPRPAPFNQADKLWGTITVRNLKTQTERIARVAARQNDQAIFEGFSLYDASVQWSPDGLYLVYWDNQCMAEGSVPGGIVCHLHEVRFLSMKPDPACREELVLGRYTFGGWAPRQSHTVLETLVNEVGQKVLRSPCAKRATAEMPKYVRLNDPEHAIALFQNYWDTTIVTGLREKNRALWKMMSLRVRTKKQLQARRETYRMVYERVKDTLTAAERETLILFGALPDLNKEGEVWVIESFIGCPCSEVAGILDAKTGRLVFVWVMPEG